MATQKVNPVPVYIEGGQYADLLSALSTSLEGLTKVILDSSQGAVSAFGEIKDLQEFLEDYVSGKEKPLSEEAMEKISDEERALQEKLGGAQSKFRELERRRSAREFGAQVSIWTKMTDTISRGFSSVVDSITGDLIRSLREIGDVSRAHQKVALMSLQTSQKDIDAGRKSRDLADKYFSFQASTSESMEAVRAVNSLGYQFQGLNEAQRAIAITMQAHMGYIDKTTLDLAKTSSDSAMDLTRQILAATSGEQVVSLSKSDIQSITSSKGFSSSNLLGSVEEFQDLAFTLTRMGIRAEKSAVIADGIINRGVAQTSEEFLDLAKLLRINIGDSTPEMIANEISESLGRMQREGILQAVVETGVISQELLQAAKSGNAGRAVYEYKSFDELVELKGLGKDRLTATERLSEWMVGFFPTKLPTALTKAFGSDFLPGVVKGVGDVTGTILTKVLAQSIAEKGLRGTLGSMLGKAGALTPKLARGGIIAGAGLAGAGLASFAGAGGVGQAVSGVAAAGAAAFLPKIVGLLAPIAPALGPIAAGIAAIGGVIGGAYLIYKKLNAPSAEKEKRDAARATVESLDHERTRLELEQKAAGDNVLHKERISEINENVRKMTLEATGLDSSAVDEFQRANEAVERLSLEYEEASERANLAKLNLEAQRAEFLSTPVSSLGLSERGMELEEQRRRKLLSFRETEVEMTRDRAQVISDAKKAEQSSMESAADRLFDSIGMQVRGVLTSSGEVLSPVVDAGKEHALQGIFERDPELKKMVSARAGRMVAAEARRYLTRDVRKDAKLGEQTYVSGSVGGMIPSSLGGSFLAGGAYAEPVRFAKGGIVEEDTYGLVGEDGAEAIIPLTKPGIAGDLMSSVLDGDVASDETKDSIWTSVVDRMLSKSTVAENMIAYARSQIGKPYSIYKDGFVCNTLVQSALSSAAKDEVEPFAGAVNRWWRSDRLKKVPLSDIRPGLIGFSNVSATTGLPQHMGIITSPSTWIHASGSTAPGASYRKGSFLASSKSKGVIESSLPEGRYSLVGLGYLDGMFSETDSRSFSPFISESFPSGPESEFSFDSMSFPESSVSVGGVDSLSEGIFDLRKDSLESLAGMGNLQAADRLMRNDIFDTGGTYTSVDHSVSDYSSRLRSRLAQMTEATDEERVEFLKSRGLVSSAEARALISRIESLSASVSALTRSMDKSVNAVTGGPRPVVQKRGRPI